MGDVGRIRGSCCNRYLSDCPAVLKHAAPLKRLEPREGTLALIPCFEGSAPPRAPLILAPSVAGGYLVSGPCVRGACGYTGGRSEGVCVSAFAGGRLLKSPERPPLLCNRFPAL